MKVRVAAWKEEGNTLEANGLIRVNQDKPKYGGIMVIQTSYEMSNGFMNTKNRVAFINGEVEELKKLVENAGLKDGDDYSAKVAPHKIIVQEKVESELTEKEKLSFREKINPSTQETLTKEGEPIYHRTLLVADGSDLGDTTIEHDTEEVTSQATAEFAGQAAAEQTK